MSTTTRRRRARRVKPEQELRNKFAFNLNDETAVRVKLMMKEQNKKPSEFFRDMVEDYITRPTNSSTTNNTSIDLNELDSILKFVKMLNSANITIK